VPGHRTSEKCTQTESLLCLSPWSPISRSRRSKQAIPSPGNRDNVTSWRS